MTWEKSRFQNKGYKGQIFCCVPVLQAWGKSQVTHSGLTGQTTGPFMLKLTHWPHRKSPNQWQWLLENLAPFLFLTDGELFNAIRFLPLVSTWLFARLLQDTRFQAMVSSFIRCGWCLVLCNKSPIISFILNNGMYHFSNCLLATFLHQN